MDRYKAPVLQTGGTNESRREQGFGVVAAFSASHVHYSPQIRRLPLRKSQDRDTRGLCEPGRTTDPIWLRCLLRSHGLGLGQYHADSRRSRRQEEYASKTWHMDPECRPSSTPQGWLAKLQPGQANTWKAIRWIPAVMKGDLVIKGLGETQTSEGRILWQGMCVDHRLHRGCSASRQVSLSHLMERSCPIERGLLFIYF